MPQGSWIVNRWWIRMPIVGRPQHRGPLLPGETRSNAPTVIAMQEEGGEVLSAQRLGRPSQ